MDKAPEADSSLWESLQTSFVVKVGTNAQSVADAVLDFDHTASKVSVTYMQKK
jgi:hypothetical protein